MGSPFEAAYQDQFADILNDVRAEVAKEYMPVIFCLLHELGGECEISDEMLTRFKRNSVIVSKNVETNSTVLKLVE